MSAQPAPDDSPPMRIVLAESLQSRDGTLTKDALVTNGYVEQLGGGIVRVYKRSGLSSIFTPASGTGFGMTSIVDQNGVESLWYATAAGTFASYNSTASLTAATSSTRTGYQNGSFFTSLGSISPTVLATKTVVFLYQDISPVSMYLALAPASLGQSFFTSLTVGDITVTSANATYSDHSTYSQWFWNTWSGTNMVAGSTYTVTLTL